jgi:hypothetical protein
MLLLVVAAALSGCGSDYNEIEQEQLGRSRDTWTAVKGSPSRHYRYADRNSSLTGASWETLVEVQANVVIRRTYTARDIAGVVTTTWTEEAAAVGTHTEGAPPLTVEEVYTACSSNVLSRNPAVNRITLTFHPDGVMQTCVYEPKNCQDDCAIGYRLSMIELLD